MIRDRIVVGIKDNKLSDQMQLDPDITPKKATAMARQSESVRKKQSLVRNYMCDSTALLLIYNFFVQALYNVLSIVPRNPSICSLSMVTDLTDLLVTQHFAICPTSCSFLLVEGFLWSQH
jgi:hypothetical protein